MCRHCVRVFVGRCLSLEKMDGSKCFHLEEEIGMYSSSSYEAVEARRGLDLYTLFNACP